MPRIDPLQLLTCLSVLLTPEGGILSRDQVPRLVNLMTKFSKKLVSKCVYVLILKSTETELVDLFMAEGGWSLIQTWLQDAVQTSNWDLVKEILGLLLVTPVDVERLKLNILPKLIKSLSRREDLEGVAQLSTQLVQRWLMIVKGTAGQIQQQVQNQEQVQSDPNSQGEAQALVLKVENETKPVALNDAVITKNEEKVNLKIEAVNADPDEGINPSSFYKTSDKDGKLLIKKLPQDSKSEYETTQENTEKIDEKRDTKEKGRNRSKISKSTSSKSKVKEKGDIKSAKDAESEREKSKKKSSSSSSGKYKSSNSRNKDENDKDKHRDKGKDREKYKERDRSKDVDKEKHRSNGALKSSSNSSKSSKDRKDYKDKEKEKGKHDEKKEQVEKDSNLLEKSKSPTIDKLGRIPKKIPPTEEKTKDNSFEIKKKSFSVGIRKDKENDERPKTVKIFNSKMRSTGLEEEVKPAPPRSASTNKKPTPSIQLPTIPQKRPSPPKDIRETIVPPEKKLKMDKIDVPERPGAIKLIPPKPKRPLGKGEELSTTLCWDMSFIADCICSVENDKVP